MPKAFSLVVCGLLASASVLAQRTASNPLTPYISVADPVVALTHVEVMDGTGAAALTDQTLVIDHGRIASIGASGGAQIPAGAKILDRHGDTVYPGLVGMHEHLFYVEPGNAALSDTYGASIAETGPPVLGRRRHQGAHHRQHGAVRRPERQAGHRCRS